MFHLSHSRRDIVRFVSFALALIALTVSLTLLSRWSSAASAGFNQKLNNSKPASQPISVLARTQSGRLSWIFGDPVTAAMPTSTIFTVNTTDDHDDGSCNALDCTLREAINAANSNPGADTINFSVTGTINLATELPGISDDVTISGPCGNQLTVQRSTAGGTPDFGIFTVTTASTVTFTGLTISNGSTANVGGGHCACGRHSKDTEIGCAACGATL